MKNKKFSILMGAISLSLTILTTVGNILAFTIFDPVLTSFFGMEGISNESFEENQYFKRKFKTSEEASNYADELSRRVEGEGTVLLKNDNVLPLASQNKVSMFSISTVDFYVGNMYGSGAIAGDKMLTLGQAMENAGFQVNKTLENFYNSKKSQYKRKVGGLAQGTSKDPFKWGINEVPYSEYTNDVKNSYSQYNDAAIVVITRAGCENGDLPRDMSIATDGKNTNSILTLDPNEKEMLREVRKNFNKVIVLLNTATSFECGFLDEEEYKADACLWVGMSGLGIQSIADIIAGKINPSGRLVDTFAYDSFSSPAMQNMGNYAYVDGSNKETGHHYLSYSEGIYVGYKYYETRYEDKMLNQGQAGNFDYDSIVQFPFGFGLSYTDFTWSNYSCEIVGNNVNISVNVKNTGNKTGKEVVQVYYQSPYTDYDIENQIEKASVNLIDIAKTKLLAPGEDQIVKLSFTLDDMKSYDAQKEKTYILESSNDYFITASKNAHEATKNILQKKGLSVDGNTSLVSQHKIDGFDVSKDEVSNHQITNLFDEARGTDIKYLSRHNWSQMDNNGLIGGDEFGKDSDGIIYKSTISNELKTKLETIGYEASGAPQEEFVVPTTGASGNKKLIEFKGKDFNDSEWEELLNQVKEQEMIQMAKSSGHHTYAMPSVGKPYTTDTDGPSAWKSFIGDGTSSGGLPGEIVHAATFNKELCYEVGEIMGELCLWAKITGKDKNPNLTGWYAPAMNIHRTPYGGRNFEYYSEDPILSGIIGSSVVKGATDKGVVTYIKHFAMNEQETNRMTDNVTWAQEQAIREVYLKPFEMSIKDGKSLGVMSSYNRIGTIWAGGNYNLLTGVLRNEWGFNGFVVTDYMDGDYENVDQMLAAGGDAALYSMNDKKLTTTGAQALTYLRRATKHCLYAFANSNAMNGITTSTVITTGTPIYHKYIMAIDLVMGSLIGATLFICLYKLIKENKFRKEQDSKDINEEIIKEATKIPTIGKIVLISLIGAMALSSGVLTLVTALSKPEDTTIKDKEDNEKDDDYQLDNNTDLVAKYGSPTKYNLTDGSENMRFDLKTRGYYYEAEKATLSSPAKIRDGIIASGGKYVGSFEPGATMTFEIESSEDSDVLLMAAAGYWSSGTFTFKNYLSVSYGIKEDNLKEVYMGDRTIKGSGNYDSFREYVVGEMHLRKGKNIISFSSYLDAFNYDYISLIKPWDGTPDEVENIVDLNEKYGDVQKKHLKNGTSSMSFDDKVRGYYYEVENATLSSKIKIENNASASGEKNISYFNPGEYFYFNIKSTIETDALIMLSGAMYDKNDILFRNAIRINYGSSLEELNNEVNSYQQIFSGTGSWSTFKEYFVGEIHLSVGDNYVRALSLASINYDYMSLANPYNEDRDGNFQEEQEIDLVAKYGEVSKSDLQDGSDTKTFDINARGKYYEAEKAELSAGIRIEDKTNASAGHNIGNFKNGETMILEINSNGDSDVLLKLALTRWNDGDLLMKDAFKIQFGQEINSLTEEVNTFEKTIKNHKTWDSFEEYYVGEVKLVKGINIIKFTALQATNIDYICLVTPQTGDSKPVDLEAKYGNPTKSELVDGSDTHEFNDIVSGYFYEAEKAELSAEIRIENKPAASGGQNIGSFNNGKTIIFEIDSSVETDALIMLALTRWNNGTILMSDAFDIEFGQTKDNLTNKVNTSGKTIKNHQTWDSFEEYNIGEIKLEKGINYIKITGHQSVNIDYMCLVSPIVA